MRIVKAGNGDYILYDNEGIYLSPEEALEFAGQLPEVAALVEATAYWVYLEQVEPPASYGSRLEARKMVEDALAPFQDSTDGDEEEQCPSTP